jgi:hypothetical protein
VSVVSDSLCSLREEVRCRQVNRGDDGCDRTTDKAMEQGALVVTRAD